MKITSSVIAQLSAIPLPDIFNRYGIDWCEGRNFKRPWGDTATGKTPSCRYYPKTNTVGDFGTHKGGGPINFVMLMENCSFPEACKKLADMFGVAINDASGDWWEKQKSFKELQRTDRQQKYERALRFSFIADFLLANPEQKNKLPFYLLTAENKENFEDFMEEVLEDDPVHHIRADLKTSISNYINMLKAQVKETYTVTARKLPASPMFSGTFDGSLINFPIMYPGNVPLGFNNRSLVPNDPTKYHFTGIFPKTDLLYGIDVDALGRGPAILVEGLLDAERLKALGFKNAVSPLSTVLTESQYHQLRCLTDSFLLFYDGDEGGMSATQKTAKLLGTKGARYQIIPAVKGMDPDEEGLMYPEETGKKIQEYIDSL